MNKYYIKTFGCQMNVSDSERIAGFLEAQVFEKSEDIKKANLVVFNTCGVRQMAEDRVYGQIHNLVKHRTHNVERKIILTGCLANRKDVQRRLKDKVDLFFPINDFLKFKNWIIKNCLETCLPVGKVGNWKLEIPARHKNVKCFNYLSINPKYGSKKNAFVPVMTGCNNFCSYCVVPYARGREISRPAENIIAEIDKLAKNGYREITLLGQNVNSYLYRIKNLEFRIENGNTESRIKKNSKIQNSKFPFQIQNSQFAIHSLINFPILLDYLASNFPQIQFRFLTSHPKDFSDSLIDVIAKNKNINREIHLPVQAGSDKILKLMNRPYTRKKYLALIEKIRKKIPSAGFTTDVIVGFPGETENDFKKTAEVFKKVGYNEAYINKYSPRPGTAAYSLGNPISWEEKKKKEKTLRKLIKT